MTKLSIYRDRYYLRENVAPNAVYIEGKEQPFVELADEIVRAANDHLPELIVTALPFVDPNLDRPFTIKFTYDDTDSEPTQGRVAVTPRAIEWHLHEEEARGVAAMITGIGTAIDHVHFDPTNHASDHAVYCALI